ncbi:MAG: glycosyltransferase family 2 protein [bacterium]
MANPAVDTVQFVSVVIATRNNKQSLVQTLRSVEKQKFSTMETVVVDNNSTDGTTSKIQAGFPWVKYINLEEDRGAGAYNRGGEEATGELIILLSDESKLPGVDTVSRIVNKFRENRNLGAAGFRVIDRNEQEIEWFNWEYVGDYQTGYLSPAFLVGASAIRPEMFERTEGFWEPYYSPVADRDLATRIIATGAEVRYFPSITLVWNSSPKPQRGTRFDYLITRNMIWYFWRNYGISRAVYKTIGHIFNSLGEVLAGRSRPVPILKGLGEGLFKIKEAFQARKPVENRYLPLVEGKRFSPD